MPFELLKSINNAMEEQSITHKYIAEKLNVNEYTIRRILNGKTNPSYKMLVGIVSVLGKKLVAREIK